VNTGVESEIRLFRNSCKKEKRIDLAMYPPLISTSIGDIVLARKLGWKHPFSLGRKLPLAPSLKGDRSFSASFPLGLGPKKVKILLLQIQLSSYSISCKKEKRIDHTIYPPLIST